MLDLGEYQSIGEALKDALEAFAPEICLIEADREREKQRLTYREFKLQACPWQGRCKTPVSSQAIEPRSS